jgi:hypothetical protein
MLYWNEWVQIVSLWKCLIIKITYIGSDPEYDPDAAKKVRIRLPNTVPVLLQLVIRLIMMQKK